MIGPNPQMNQQPNGAIALVQDQNLPVGSLAEAQVRAPGRRLALLGVLFLDRLKQRLRDPAVVEQDPVNGSLAALGQVADAWLVQEQHHPRGPSIHIGKRGRLDAKTDPFTSLPSQTRYTPVRGHRPASGSEQGARSSCRRDTRRRCSNPGWRPSDNCQTGRA
jgi:hypothetical protein